jgi:hypothetical protein
MLVKSLGRMGFGSREALELLGMIDDGVKTIDGILSRLFELIGK